MPVTLLLDRVDALTGAPFPLRAVVRVTPALVDPGAVIDALEGAIGLGQRRYHLHRDELPSRREAVEEAARSALAVALAREGQPLQEFALLVLEPA